ncbi:MAG: hypothetical protein HUK40_03160 [Desulfobacter sp.]|nr:hypothetical protein [Desulfobacter sp.]
MKTFIGISSFQVLAVFRRGLFFSYLTIYLRHFLGLSVIELFWSMSNIGWSAMISDIYKQGNRSRIMGQLESMGGMGRIVGILVGGLLYDRMGTLFIPGARPPTLRDLPMARFNLSV